MKTVAILPLRKGSKSIKNKNKKKLLGRPLYQWILGEAIHSNIDEIYVFTDDEEIIERVKSVYKWTDKVKTWLRSENSATDTASTESGMLELAEGINYDFDILCLLQATSPLLTKEDINKGMNKLVKEGYDSVLSAVNSKRFIWNEEGKSVNYDYRNRPRRQDFPGFLIENGALYLIKKESYLKENNRLYGKIGIVEMPEDTLVEIDEPADWVLIEQILSSRLKSNKKASKKIKALVLDVDGVFTDGTMIVSPEGELGKAFSLRDGMALEIFREAGLEVIVMTSEDSPIVDQRMKKLNIQHYYKWAKDKYSLITKCCNDLNIGRDELAYIGDDVNDMANLLSVGWGMAPVDAVNEIKVIADLVLHSKGGDMAIREGIDFIMKLNNRN
ncbi:acylneuraminate cytidylyltransferase [Mucilaginibacter ginsenosidivorax]|uniref:N-acylneuraminate cytidylyltransferase n=1 Tax=Mucilaginibacter ginsenosidivorax TaxID=862126 RepID=A0A5B8W560_9SPHI|nr:acylneuraminate cytidylyltransferase [Mucilaginibacter ginsenosidivorax]QEC78072.1 acylneuraminate cytidylyltransferase [Mucilaginibacter ginsenosidivorax]